MDEHAAVLKSLDEVRALLAQGRPEPVPSLIEALVDWFPGHVHHLDSALAAWMCKRRRDARPVVLRRGAANGAANSAANNTAINESDKAAHPAS